MNNAYVTVIFSLRTEISYIESRRYVLSYYKAVAFGTGTTAHSKQTF